MYRVVARILKTECPKLAIANFLNFFFGGGGGGVLIFQGRLQYTQITTIHRYVLIEI